MKWRNGEDLHPMRMGTRTISLAPSPGTLVRIPFPKRSSRQELHPQLTDLKSVASAGWATGGKRWYLRKDLHPRPIG